MNEIGKRLRSLREGVRLTQVNMAEILGVQQSRINRYETGQSTPDPEIFIKYADYFDVSMDYLYCRTDDPRGKLYDYQPEVLKAKTEQSREMREFIEMCFDPKAPVNKRLKEALFRLMTEEANEE
ncbi:helix-turn-helix transcriptional regulator [uncultured Oscillibacter sp.]|uniref:helix-turn-helix domain-containing protein n=1 Tax=uncultured Oscillibacter sp. TaxID=876091 RepID=UPI00261116A4|nr:helix-turn-helix transcriptional regulator [uncultured Oscillibacter sp.]